MIKINNTQNYKDKLVCEGVLKMVDSKPIVISESEKIEVGDLFYDKYHGTIHQYNGTQVIAEKYNFKILALTEHFSPQQLQMIVDGKLKEGKCLLECEKYIDPNKTPAQKRIQLNPHITIYPVEEENPNMYGLEIGKQYWFQYTGCKSDWFCGIVERFTQFGHPWVKSTDGSLHNGIISPGLYKVQHVSLNPPVEEKMYTREEMEENIVNFVEFMFSKSSSYNSIEQLRYKVNKWINNGN